MSSKFTALPLTSGEAFVLETEHEGDDIVILFDGGQDKKIGPQNGLYRSLREHCPDILHRIDIAVCSHSDHDHSGGFPSFVETWISEGNEIGEFWLPALWSPALPEVLTNPDSLVWRLRQGAGQAARQIVAAATPPYIAGKARTLDAREMPFRSIDQIIRDQALKQVRPEPGSRTLFAEEQETSEDERVATSLGLQRGELEIVRRNIEESHLLQTPMEDRLRLTTPHATTFFLGLDWTDSRPEAFQLEQSLLSGVIETAEAIRRIAVVAASHDIPIRWFDFTPFERDGALPSGGMPGLLEPLNTVETRHVRREADSLVLFFSLKLTEQNVSSLVFQRIENRWEPSVIFVADSRLAFGIDRPERPFPNHLRPVTRPIVFTSPHHGSRNNDEAYGILEQWLGSTLYKQSYAVRNGGVHNQTLTGYLDCANRRCAQCYQCHGGEWAQPVIARGLEGQWVWPPDLGRPCGIVKSKRR